MYGISFCGRQHAFVGHQSINVYPNYLSISFFLVWTCQSFEKYTRIKVLLLLQNIAVRSAGSIHIIVMPLLFCALWNLLSIGED